MKIEFDADLKYSELIRIMDVCLKAGFASVGPTPLLGGSAPGLDLELAPTLPRLKR